MATVDLDPHKDDRVLLISSYHELWLAEQIPGARHDKKRSPDGMVAHTLPRTWATWMALQGIYGNSHTLQIGDGYRAWLTNEWTTRVEPCLQLRQSTNVMQDPRTPWDANLYPFQRAGVAMMALARRALLADEMGTGKTAQSISTVRRLADYGTDPFPVLCIVPNSTKAQWREEWGQWYPGRTVSVVGGTATERTKALKPGYDVYVIHWEAVPLHSRLEGFGDIRLRKCDQCDRKKGDPKLAVSRCETHRKELNTLGFKTVIADEAHYMKNPEAKRTRAVWAVQHGPTVENAIALTGTPIADTPEDLWPIMHGLHPGEYPKKSAYRERYCLLSWNWNGELVVTGINPNTAQEFFGFFDPRFRRMPKALVLPFLPPMVYTTREAPMTPKQARAYKEMEEHLMTEVGEDGLLVAPNNLAKQTRLLQFASAMCTVNEAGEVIMTEPSPKLDVMMEIVNEAASPLVVCAESRKLINLASARLEAAKIPHGVLVGGMTDDQRAAVLHEFNSGRTQLLLFTMKAGGTGLNMTVADKMIRLERSWSMLLNYQTMNRVHRIGSERHTSITVIDVVAPKTKEVTQFRRLGEKMARLEEITRDKMTLRQAGRLQEVALLEREEHALINSTLLA